MKTTPKSERKHIAFVGRRNAGKSSLINAFVGQDLCIVSEIPGTTTDPVKKSMELAPFGPVVLIDTAGIDDVGELGAKRIEKSLREITSADFVIYVISANAAPDKTDLDYFDFLERMELPYLVVVNKTDLSVSDVLIDELNRRNIRYFKVSALKNKNIEKLKEIVALSIPSENAKPLIGDLVKQGETIVLVVPIDLGAPKGRLIMPQVQSIREALDEDAVVIVCKDKELRAVLDNLKNPPKLIVTDSQAVMRVDADVPKDILLTTFSILMARYKGNLAELVSGLNAIEKLKNGDNILIAEACSHHAQEDDIGRVKIPRWLNNYSKKNLNYFYSAGYDFPSNLSEYKLVIHCGACTLTRKKMLNRIKMVKIDGVPVVNYGVLISYLQGAFPRVLEPFPELSLLQSINYGV